MSERRKIIGKDLKLGFDRLGADLTATAEGDLDTVSAEDNLAQAIILRLSIEEGELYDVGHADYGSRLYDLIGEVNNDAVRERIKVVVRNCLSQEPRIREIISVGVRTDPYDLNCVYIDMTVLPSDSENLIALTYPFRLEVE